MLLLNNTLSHVTVYGLSIGDHGGNCCGIHHLYDFPNLTPSLFNVNDDMRRTWIKAAINEAIDDYDPCDDLDCGCESKGSSDEWRTAIEVILVKKQLDEWQKPLEDCGFKEVFSFHNTNSGNRCHVFYIETNT